MQIGLAQARDIQANGKRSQFDLLQGDGFGGHAEHAGLRYSFKIPNTDVWSANITTGRGLAESVGRRIAELDDDAKHRDRIAETKRRRIVELTGLQGRAFTHADELVQDRQRLEAVKLELEKSSNASATAGDGDGRNEAAAVNAGDDDACTVSAH